VVFKDEILKGEQPAILDRDLFDAVQAEFSEKATNHQAARTKSEALLAGRIFDDRGNRMTPSHARKGDLKYRCYLSSSLLQGAPERAGSVRRVPAAELEALVVRSVREHIKPLQPVDDRSLAGTYIERVEVQPGRLVVRLSRVSDATSEQAGGGAVLQVPWRKTCPYRKSNPDVLMVQSSQERLGDDAANCLNRPRNRCILAQR
jgi:site-specific DNA recombinase